MEESLSQLTLLSKWPTAPIKDLRYRAPPVCKNQLTASDLAVAMAPVRRRQHLLWFADTAGRRESHGIPSDEVFLSFCTPSAITCPRAVRCSPVRRSPVPGTGLLTLEYSHSYSASPRVHIPQRIHASGGLDDNTDSEHGRKG